MTKEKNRNFSPFASRNKLLFYSFGLILLFILYSSFSINSLQKISFTAIDPYQEHNQFTESSLNQRIIKEIIDKNCHQITERLRGSEGSVTYVKVFVLDSSLLPLQFPSDKFTSKGECDSKEWVNVETVHGFQPKIYSVAILDEESMQNIPPKKDIEQFGEPILLHEDKTKNYQIMAYLEEGGGDDSGYYISLRVLARRRFDINNTHIYSIVDLPTTNVVENRLAKDDPLLNTLKNNSYIKNVYYSDSSQRNDIQSLIKEMNRLQTAISTK